MALTPNSIDTVCQAMARIAPLHLAEEWDNVGLLLGDRQAAARRVLTCLTVTPAVVEEAIDDQADLLIAHHPLPFRPLSRITTDSTSSELVWRLCRAGIGLYSAHTAYDSAAEGINRQWLDRLSEQGLQPGNIRPLLPSDTVPELGAGRVAELAKPISAQEILAISARISGATRPRLVGNPAEPISRIGIACGSGGSFVSAAQRLGCDALLTGEATFHQCLEAENSGISLLLVGHYASERFAVEQLVEQLASELLSPTGDDLASSQRQTGSQSVPASPAHPDEGAVWIRASRRERDVITVDPVSQKP